jgi:hypothetical protein
MAEINNEIRATLAISQNEALTGTIRTLTLANGKQVSIAIPPRSQNGQVLSIPSSGSETLLLTLAISQESLPQANSYPPYAAYTPPLAPPPPGMNRPDTYGNYQFSEFVPGGQVPYPVPPFPNSQSYPAYPPSPRSPLFQGQTLPAQPGQVLPAEAPKKLKRSVWLYNLLIFLVLIIIVGSALTYLFGSYVPTQEHAQATATMQANATRAVFTQVTATTQVENTATAQTNATATVVAPYIDTYNTITSGTPTLNDDLSAPSTNNWDTGPMCTFKDNAYHIIENEKGYFRDCFAQAATFSNFAYQVQMTLLKGNSGGIAFRATSDSGKMYVFLVDSTGNYVIYAYPSLKASDARTLDSGISPSFIQGYNKQNLLSVIAKGFNIDLYINKQYLTSVQDSALTAGQVGVLANYRDTATEVSYNQAKVWSIS